MSIQTFPLAWRWNSPIHNVLPPEVLVSLVPLTNAAARAIDWGFTTPLQSPTLTHDASGDFGTTVDWLQSLPVPGGRVLAGWSQDTALSLPWETFVAYWDDFCYPSSDDVVILFPATPHRLLYHHWEVFDYVVQSSNTPLQPTGCAGG